jgi:hypothetical protein
MLDAGKQAVELLEGAQTQAVQYSKRRKIEEENYSSPTLELTKNPLKLQHRGKTHVIQTSNCNSSSLKKQRLSSRTSQILQMTSKQNSNRNRNNTHS